MLLPSRTYNGVLAITAANFDFFVSGDYQGGQWREFQEAVGLGWVSNTPTGYETFISWWAAPSSEKLSAGLYEFQGWNMARLGVSAQTMVASASGWVKNGYVTTAQAQLVIDAYNRYAGTAVPASLPTAPTADPSYPQGIQLLLAGPPVTQPLGTAAGIVIAYRTATVYTGALGPGQGNVKLGPWGATPGNWLTMLGVEWRGGAEPLLGIYGSRWVGLDPDSVGFASVAQQQLSGDPYNAFTLPARAAVDTPAFEAWLRSALPSWNAPTGPTTLPTAPGPVPTGTVTPVPPPPTLSGPIRPTSSVPTGGAATATPGASSPGGGGTTALVPTLQVGPPGVQSTPVAVTTPTPGTSAAASGGTSTVKPTGVWFALGLLALAVLLSMREG